MIHRTIPAAGHIRSAPRLRHQHPSPSGMSDGPCLEAYHTVCIHFLCRQNIEYNPRGRNQLPDERLLIHSDRRTKGVAVTRSIEQRKDRRRLACRLLAAAGTTIALRAWLTFAGQPVLHWYYLSASLGMLGILASLPCFAAFSRKTAVGIGTTFFVLMVVCLGMPWTSRDFFLRDFQRIRIGMTATEAALVMRGYAKEASIPDLPATGSIHAGEGAVSCEAYRHSNARAWSADRGIICLGDGRVVKTSFDSRR